MLVTYAPPPPPPPPGVEAVLIDLWYDGRESFDFGFTDADGLGIPASVGPGESFPSLDPTELACRPAPVNTCLRIDHSLPQANGDIEVFFLIIPRPGAASTIDVTGTWSFTLSGTPVTNGDFDAWITCFGAFCEFPGGDTQKTVGEPGVAEKALTVASYVTKPCWDSVNGREFLFRVAASGPWVDILLLQHRAHQGRAHQARHRRPPDRESPPSSPKTPPSLPRWSCPTASTRSWPVPAWRPPRGRRGGPALAQDPSRTSSQIKALMQDNAVADTFTGPVCNNTWGCGKLDISGLGGAPAPSELLVNSNLDTVDAVLGDGVCADAAGNCSVRAAIEEANALSSPPSGFAGVSGSGITINIPADTYTLTQGSELLINADMSLVGAGAEVTIIQASATPPGQPGAATHRVLNIAGGNVAISDVTIRHGTPPSGAGGIFNNGATLTLADSIISENGGSLGGILNGGGGTMTVTNSTVRNNSGTADSGGILNSQNTIGTPRNTLAVVDSTINDNGSRGLWNGGTLTVINTTISGNTFSGNGAGIYNFSGSGSQNATASVTNSTITGNSSSSKSGIWNNKTITVINTIVAGNTAPSQPDCNSFTSQGHNLIGDGSGCSFAPGPGDQVGTDIAPIDSGLEPLANYGGPTETHALRPDSPAIDAGDDAVLGAPPLP